VLIYNKQYGYAYENYRNKTIKYGKRYWNKIKRYEYTPISNAMHQFRIDLTKKYMNPADVLIDIGIGCGEFIKRHPYIKVYGYDINPYAVKWLKENNIYKDIYEEIRDFTHANFFTMWDTLEHIPEPAKILFNLPITSYLFVSIPIFDKLEDIEKSKHYRKKEHYWYFTEQGFEAYIKSFQYKIVHVDDYETKAGRENIKTFVCIKL